MMPQYLTIFLKHGSEDSSENTKFVCFQVKHHQHAWLLKIKSYSFVIAFHFLSYVTTIIVSDTFCHDIYLPFCLLKMNRYMPNEPNVWMCHDICTPPVLLLCVFFISLLFFTYIYVNICFYVYLYVYFFRIKTLLFYGFVCLNCRNVIKCTHDR